MSPDLGENIILTARCLCKAHTFKAEIARSSVPLKARSCHCNSCRHVSGAMYCSSMPWPGAANEIQQSPLKEYAFGKTLTILFCGTCSSKLFWRIRSDDLEGPVKYKVFTGVLDNIDAPNLLQFTDHIFVGDTLDGGATPWLCGPDASGVRARRWAAYEETSQEIDGDWPPVGALPDAGIKPELGEYVPFRCHCGGVDLVLRRSDREFEGEAPPELPWFVDPITHKSLASFDACDSCRMQAGADVYHWTFALLRQVAFPRKPGTWTGTGTAEWKGVSSNNSNSSFPTTSHELREAVSIHMKTSAQEGRDTGGLGTLALYASSPDVQRYFCSRCSACVFYCVDDRPETADVAMGLLDAPSGARAEEFVSWAFGGESSWRGDMVGGWREGHINAVESSAEAWRVERKYPKNWRRLEREKAKALGE